MMFRSVWRIRKYYSTASTSPFKILPLSVIVVFPWCTTLKSLWTHFACHIILQFAKHHTQFIIFLMHHTIHMIHDSYCSTFGLCRRNPVHQIKSYSWYTILGPSAPHFGFMHHTSDPSDKYTIALHLVPGAYLGFCQGGCTFFADLPPPPPPGSGSGSASRFWAGSGSGSASKQCGSTALGSTVKRLLSNLYLCIG